MLIRVPKECENICEKEYPIFNFMKCVSYWDGGTRYQDIKCMDLLMEKHYQCSQCIQYQKNNIFKI